MVSGVRVVLDQIVSEDIASSSPPPETFQLAGWRRSCTCFQGPDCVSRDEQGVD
ncbi:hypothetical protein KC19_9G043700 [Ceratodon purpureus]|uniref:Uncharacterized protein n=1 Tax=Ceratodon purpureus TaxID=3225 RepID=A0A8T0GSQ5_CERPU|nr:hypothetical protein KC19_9G043700 [Ceratodon purpureus]